MLPDVICCQLAVVDVWTWTHHFNSLVFVHQPTRTHHFNCGICSSTYAIFVFRSELRWNYVKRLCFSTSVYQTAGNEHFQNTINFLSVVVFRYCFFMRETWEFIEARMQMSRSDADFLSLKRRTRY